MSLTKGLNIYFNILTHKYSKEQFQQILLGKKRNIDVSIYSNPKFGWRQMQEIRFGLERNLNVSIYANPELTGEQMEQTRLEIMGWA